MSQTTEKTRLLIYSHDSFGLGHLRRCRAIAHSLVDHRQGLSVLILSGSPIIGSFDFRASVDFVRIPGVVKLRTGGYTTLGLDIGIEDAMAIRETIIRNTAEVFKPNIFLVDKEPLGLRGEVGNTLKMLKNKGTRLVLGLRDVMDDPGKLTDEWERKMAIPALRDIYDDIWVYGRSEICNPLEGVGNIPKSVVGKLSYTGYLRRTSMPSINPSSMAGSDIQEPFILVTPGGGGDGASLVDWVLRAYEHDPSIPHKAFIVFGPFMHVDSQSEFKTRIERIPNVEATTFDANIEHLMSKASSVIAMGGYNTFCEILSFDKPSLIVPRTVPRLEQYIRASKAEELGLVSMIVDDGSRDPKKMARAIKELPNRPKPSEIHLPGLLDGLSSINGIVDQWLNTKQRSEPSLRVVPNDS
ncbi:MAG: glycosyltransferase [Rhodospirillales bacterium]|jgi:predicted glycosyltransferase